MTRPEFEAYLAKKAVEDPEFRKKLLEDPKGTLQAELDETKPGFTLPDDLKVSVLEEKPDQIYLTLPIEATSKGAIQDETAKGGGPSVATTAVVTGPVATVITSAVCIDVVQVTVTSINVVIDNAVAVVSVAGIGSAADDPPGDDK